MMSSHCTFPRAKLRSSLKISTGRPFHSFTRFELTIQRTQHIPWKVAFRRRTFSWLPFRALRPSVKSNVPCPYYLLRICKLCSRGRGVIVLHRKSRMNGAFKKSCMQFLQVSGLRLPLQGRYTSQSAAGSANWIEGGGRRSAIKSVRKSGGT